MRRAPDAVPVRVETSLLGPLHLPNYRLFIGASSIDQAGLWVQLTVLGWLALQLTDSAFLVSIANVVWFIPFLFLALPSGVIADRLDRRRSLIIIHFIQSSFLMVMSALAASDHMSYPVLLVLTACVSSMVALDLPLRQSIVVMLVRPSQVLSATALTQSTGSLMRIFGPLIAGFVLSTFGAAAGFGFYAFTQLAFASTLVVLKRSEAADGSWRSPAGKARSPLKETPEGLRYVAHNRDVRGLVLLSIGAGSVGWVYLALMPVMARDVLGGGSFLLGLLGTGVGIGGFPAGIWLAFRKNLPMPGVLMVCGFLLWGACVILFALSPSPAPAFVLLVVAGVGFTFQSALGQALILNTTAPDFHGRVFGVMSFTWGANIIGTLTAGSLSDALGARTVIAGSGFLILAVTVAVVATHRQVLRLR